jgi:hypothetical protein
MERLKEGWRQLMVTQRFPGTIDRHFRMYGTAEIA